MTNSINPSSNSSASIGQSAPDTPSAGKPFVTGAFSQLLNGCKYDQALALLEHIQDTSQEKSVGHLKKSVADSFLNALTSHPDAPDELIDLTIAKAKSLEVVEREFGATALLNCASNNNLRMAQKLIAAGAKIDATDKDGMSFLHNAALSGDEKMLSFALSVLPEQLNSTSKGDFGMLELLDQVPQRSISNDDDYDEDSGYSYRPSRRSYSQDPYDEPEPEYLSEEELHPRSEYFPNEGYTPLMCAIESGSLSCVRLLLEHGANPNCAKPIDEHFTRSALCLNAYGPHQDTVKIHQLLLNFGASDCPDSTGYTPFLIAANSGNIPLFSHLLDQGANPDALHDIKSFPSVLGFSRTTNRPPKIEHISARECIIKQVARFAGKNLATFSQRYENLLSLLEAYDLRRSLEHNIPNPQHADNGLKSSKPKGL